MAVAEEDSISSQVLTTLEKPCNFTMKYVNVSEADVIVDVIDLHIFNKSEYNIEYLPVIWTYKLVTYIKQPSLFDSTPYLLAAPFSASLWIRFGVILLLSTFTLSATWYLGDCYVRRKNDEAFTVRVSCFCVFGSFCQQAHHTTPRSWSCRLVYFTLYSTAVMVFTAYSAVIIDHLAFLKPMLPFHTFKGLLDDGTYDFGIRSQPTMGQSPIVLLFRKDDDPAVEAVYTKFIMPHRKSQPDNIEGLQRLCDSNNYAFMIEPSIFLRYRRYVTCEVVQVPKAFVTGSVSFIIARNSPYRRFLKRKLHDLTRFGILRALKKRFVFAETWKDSAPKTQSAITMTVVKFILAILAIGLALSITVFIIERKSCCQRRRPSVNIQEITFLP